MHTCCLAFLRALPTSFSTLDFSNTDSDLPRPPITCLDESASPVEAADELADVDLTSVGWMSSSSPASVTAWQFVGENDIILDGAA